MVETGRPRKRSLRVDGRTGEQTSPRRPEKIIRQSCEQNVLVFRSAIARGQNVGRISRLESCRAERKIDRRDFLRYEGIKGFGPKARRRHWVGGRNLSQLISLCEQLRRELPRGLQKVPQTICNLLPASE